MSHREIHRIDPAIVVRIENVLSGDRSISPESGGDHAWEAPDRTRE